ncbi:MAG TPA: flagellar hook capping FlgD N-terminal domain-containing protein [Candidatus Baltobacteraceae bacterium]|jgi:flagellar basal-body rod modification protein FlgD|nr:flagellar hook capping FlgD N-terminal domain-containing protein [Candidatus Baltobacteraceae bacterium]
MQGITPFSGATQSPTGVSNSNSLASASNQALGANDFLQLLTTEMQNQDPLQPVDDTQSVAQLAQFSALQATNELNTSFQNFQSNFGVLQSSALIGKQVTVVSTDATGNSANITGTVTGIQVQNGQPFFTMNNSGGQPITGSNGQPLLFATTQITAIGG